ncbi:MAG: YkgJ family cysteine cluster protein [Candidatus Hodarchaeota archaeon]
MSNLKELRFICTRCGNCCSDKNTIVNTTYFDILRIKNGLNLNLEEILEVIGFYIYDKGIHNEKHKMVVSPIETERGLAFIGLLKKESGLCYFYDEKNKSCKIYNLRPTFCRTFPFSFNLILNKSNKTSAKIKMFYTEKGKEYCPGIGNDAPLINEEKWLELGKQTIEELNNNEILIEKWNNTVKLGQITPTVKNFLLTIFRIKKINQD